jgi:hypothetical protein
MMTPAEHNDPEWLAVRWEENSRGQGFLAGWYVVRVCPCHRGERVTLPLQGEADAQRVRRVLLGLEKGKLAPAPREWSPDPERPTAVLPGQVWRRNRLRDGRYFRVLAVKNGQVEIATVDRGEDGGWVPGGQNWRKIAVRRLLQRPKPGAPWPYTMIE